MGLEGLEQHGLAHAAQPGEHGILEDGVLLEKPQELGAFDLSTGQVRRLMSSARAEGVLEVGHPKGFSHPPSLEPKFIS